jgi:hypothetical protein
MQKDLIHSSITKVELQLELIESILYFRFPILCVLITVLCFTTGFQSFEFSNLAFSDPMTKAGSFFLGLGAVSYIIKLKRLKLLYINVAFSDVKEKIFELAEQRNWITEQQEEKLIIFKTVPRQTYDDYPHHDKTKGELIYIFSTPNKILIKSIDNLQNFGVKIQNGENRANEKAIITAVELPRYSKSPDFGSTVTNNQKQGASK